MATEPSLTETLRPILNEYEQAYQHKLQEAQAKIADLERENQILRQQAGKETLFGEILNQALRERFMRLGSNAPLDTFIRESGVILEHYLRQTANEEDKAKFGVRLVDSVLKPPDATLRFSDHGGEQDGVWQLYRGAMQFIRNPPMHKLIDYDQGRVHALIRLMDGLLQLLAETQKEPADDLLDQDVTGMQPTNLTILGRNISVKTWRDVAVETMDALAAIDPQTFEDFATQNPSLFSQDESQFRRAQQLKNGYFIEVNRSAKNIVRFCQRAVEALGLSLESWHVKTRG
ncbi:MAG: hypothetical protein H6668_19670 [Ardenticatenaceae bacterium]|nr:hypothetical protein [Ardenticatenaceae bacterium]